MTADDVATGRELSPSTAPIAAPFLHRIPVTPACTYAQNSEKARRPG
ncbi:hypothetical protein ACQP1O_06730 [Nocardia sp. CA-151230]